MTDRTVGHFRTHYLKLTETFIYRYLTNHDTYDPFVCSIAAMNLDKFPFSDRIVLDEMPAWSARRWIYTGLHSVGLSSLYFGAILSAKQPDIVHAHFGPMGIRLSPRLPNETPLVTSFYGYDLSQAVIGSGSIKDRVKRVYFRHSYEKLFQNGDLFLVEGPAMRDRLVNLGCDREKAKIQHIGLDTHAIDPAYSEQDRIKTVLMVGRYVEKKGMPDGIRAFANVFKGRDVVLRIVGGEASHGFSEAELKSIASDAGVSEQTDFTGYLEYDAYLREVRECDVLLVPSKTATDGDSEGGAPTVILEAQALGKPIVGTTHADIPYYVTDGISGALASPGNVSEISDALVRLDEEPELLKTYGEAGREYVREEHEIKELVPQLEHRYDVLLES